MSAKAKPAADDAYLDPMHSFGHLTRLSFRDFSRVLERLTLPYGVSSGQWRLLRVLWEEDDITQKTLSDRAGTTEATTVHAVRSLVNAGLATRRRCTIDKRKAYVKLTPRARRLRRTLMPKIREVNEIATAGIDPTEVEIARKVLEKTMVNLSAKLKEMNGEG